MEGRMGDERWDFNYKRFNKKEECLGGGRLRKYDELNCECEKR